MSSPPVTQASERSSMIAPFPRYKQESNVRFDYGVLVHKGSLRVKQDNSTGKHYLDFDFDASIPGRIIIRFLCPVIENVLQENGTPAITVSVFEGLNQKFVEVSNERVDIASCLHKEGGSYKVLIIKTWSLDAGTIGANPVEQLNVVKFENENIQPKVIYQGLVHKGVKYTLFNPLGLVPEPDSRHVAGSRKIGDFMIFSVEMGRGSYETTVYEGLHQCRAVAVKKIPNKYYEDSREIIKNLIQSDEHANIVRYYRVESDHDFQYLALERCICTLEDLALSYKGWGENVRSSKEEFKDFILWNEDRSPTTDMKRLMRGIVSGIAHLHRLGIIHHDLKPKNVLIRKDARSLHARISDAGVTKVLGSVRSGWEAPEVLKKRDGGNYSLESDLFSLGCVLYFCITRDHPYNDGDDLHDRITNIIIDYKNILQLDGTMPEAHDMVVSLLNRDPKFRPKAEEIHRHPFFWDASTRLSFLRDASDRLAKETYSALWKSLRNNKRYHNWHKKVDIELIQHIDYNAQKNGVDNFYSDALSLLRTIRSMYGHFDELPEDVKAVLGVCPTGFDTYFSLKFPGFLMVVYKAMKKCSMGDGKLRRYYEDMQF